MLRAVALEAFAPRCQTWAVAEQLRGGVLRRVLTDWQAPVYPGNRLTPMKIRAFVHHLARSFGRTPNWGGRHLRLGHVRQNLE